MSEFTEMLYDIRGDLLDTAAEAAINERPFYLQSKLDEVNEQIRIVENITPEAQEDYMRRSILEYRYPIDSERTREISLNGWKATATPSWIEKHL